MMIAFNVEYVFTLIVVVVLVIVGKPDVIDAVSRFLQSLANLVRRFID